LYDHHYFVRAAKGAIRCYLNLHDHPEWKNPPMISEEKKKLHKSAKKELNEEHKEKAKSSKTTKQQDEDPDGRTLIENKNMLQEVLPFLHKLKTYVANDIDTWVLAYQVYRRMNKPLLLLQSLRKGLNIDANHPDLHICIIEFLLSSKCDSMVIYYNNLLSDQMI
jgi:hypothetical protein